MKSHAVDVLSGQPFNLQRGDVILILRSYAALPTLGPSPPIDPSHDHRAKHPHARRADDDGETPRNQGIIRAEADL